jgi:hypothetical protein
VGLNNTDTHALAIFALLVGCERNAIYTSQRRGEGVSGISECKRGNYKLPVSAVGLVIFIWCPLCLCFGLRERRFQGNLISKTICRALLDLFKRIHCISRRHHGSRRKGRKYFVLRHTATPALNAPSGVNRPSPTKSVVNYATAKYYAN